MDIIYFEDIDVGRTVTKDAVYLITEEEIRSFARVWDPRPFHVDADAAASSVFGGFAACSAHIFSILTWFGSRSGGRTAALAALGFDEMRMHSPVRPGDSLRCSVEFLEKRESRSREDRGIVRYRCRLINQEGVVPFSVVVTALVAKRPA